MGSAPSGSAGFRCKAMGRSSFAWLARPVRRSNRVRTLFTSVRNEADRVGATQPVGFTYVDSHALRTLYEAPCGSGGWSSRYFPNTVGFIPHRGKGCLGEGCDTNLLRNSISFYHQCIPRSGMAVSPKFPLRIWLAKPTLCRGPSILPRTRYRSCWSIRQNIDGKRAGKSLEIARHPELIIVRNRSGLIIKTREEGRVAGL